jgi:hypothetical protein
VLSPSQLSGASNHASIFGRLSARSAQPTLYLQYDSPITLALFFAARHGRQRFGGSNPCASKKARCDRL